MGRGKGGTGRGKVQGIKNIALAGVAQWIEHGPASQKVAGLIPSLGHMPGFPRPGLQWRAT